MVNCLEIDSAFRKIKIWFCASTKSLLFLHSSLRSQQPPVLASATINNRILLAYPRTFRPSRTIVLSFDMGNNIRSRFQKFFLVPLQHSTSTVENYRPRLVFSILRDHPFHSLTHALSYRHAKPFSQSIYMGNSIRPVIPCGIIFPDQKSEFQNSCHNSKHGKNQNLEQTNLLTYLNHEAALFSFLVVAGKTIQGQF